MLLALWISLAVAAAIKRSPATAIFLCCTLAHHMMCGDIDSGWYYITASAFDAISVVMLGLVDAECRRAAGLQTISMVSLVLNAAGLFAYEQYFNTGAYHAAFIILYAIAVIVALGGSTRVERLGAGSIKRIAGGSDRRIVVSKELV